MSNQCDICPEIITSKEESISVEQGRVLTSPAYWSFVFTTKPSYFQEKMLNSYLEMMCKDAGNFTVCPKCKKMLDGDSALSAELGIAEFVNKSANGSMDKNAAAVVLGAVWKKLHGNWPSTINVKGSDVQKNLPSGQNQKINSSENNKGKTTLINDNLIKKAEENSWASIVQKQVAEFDKRYSSEEIRVKELDKRNNELEKMVKDIESNYSKYVSQFEGLQKKNSDLEKQIKELNKKLDEQAASSKLLAAGGGKAKTALVLSIILLVLFLIMAIVLSGKVSDITVKTAEIENKLTQSPVQVTNNPVEAPRETQSPVKNKNKEKAASKNEAKIKNEKLSEVVSVPAVTGLSSSSAQSRISAAGLRANIIKVSYGYEHIDKVVRQNPAANKMVKRGTAVILQVGE